MKRNHLFTALKFIVFFCLLTVVTMRTYSVLSWKDTYGIDNLYHYKNDTVDVLFVGSSHSDCTINTALLWEQYGMAADDITENGQTLPFSYYYLNEALKTQHPKVVCIELRGADLNVGFYNGNMYRNTINMKWSNDYPDLVQYAVDGIKWEHDIDSQINTVQKGLLLKFPVVHSRYNDISKQDYIHNPRYLRYSSNYTVKKYDLPEACSNMNAGTISIETQEYLNKILDLSKEKGFELILWVAPYVVTDSSAMIYNAIENYAEHNGITFINFLHNLDETGFDFATDMRKEEYYGSHMNTNGATKITNYMGQLLNDNYDLPDRRNESNYERYDRMLRNWKVVQTVHNLSEANYLVKLISQVDTELFDITLVTKLEQKDLPTNEVLRNCLEAKTNVPGLYTTAKYNRISKTWMLSPAKLLLIPDNDIENAKFFNGTKQVAIKDCDICVIVTDKLTGDLINKSEFKKEDDFVYKKI